MTGIMTRSTEATEESTKADKGLYALSFVVVLFIAILAQILFLKWRPWFPGSESEQSLIGAVRAGVYTFMSHLN